MDAHILFCEEGTHFLFWEEGIHFLFWEEGQDWGGEEEEEAEN